MLKIWSILGIPIALHPTSSYTVQFQEPVQSTCWPMVQTRLLQCFNKTVLTNNGANRHKPCSVTQLRRTYQRGQIISTWNLFCVEKRMLIGRALWVHLVVDANYQYYWLQCRQADISLTSVCNLVWWKLHAIQINSFSYSLRKIANEPRDNLQLIFSAV
jgi:hypothetical protein